MTDDDNKSTILAKSRAYGLTVAPTNFSKGRGRRSSASRNMLGSSPKEFAKQLLHGKFLGKFSITNPLEPPRKYKNINYRDEDRMCEISTILFTPPSFLNLKLLKFFGTLFLQEPARVSPVPLKSLTNSFSKKYKFRLLQLFS